MKYIHVSWTYLDTIEVDDDMDADDIEAMLDKHPDHGFEKPWNDREWDYAPED